MSFPSFEDWKAIKKVEGINLNNASLGITEEDQRKAYETEKEEFEKAQNAASKKPAGKKLTLEQLFNQKVLANVNPDAVRNITALNEIIPIILGAGVVGAPATEANRTKQSGKKTIGGIFKKQCAAKGGAEKSAACAWPIMDSEGKGNDCLIHSFLTATCPNFRRLEIDHKRQFARSFRVDLLPRYPEMKDHLKKKDEDGLTGRARLIENDPKTGKLRFLGDEDAQIIISIFQVNLVIFQAERQVEGFVANPAMATLFINFPDNKVFFIYNNGINHFESVKPNDTYYLEFDANQYDRFHSRKKGESIKKDELTTIIEPFLVQTGEETKPQCEYKEGDFVMYNGKEYEIQSYKYGDANKDGIVRCKTLEIKDNDGNILNISVDELNKKRPHNNAAAPAAMVAGPGPEHKGKSAKRSPNATGINDHCKEILLNFILDHYNTDPGTATAIIESSTNFEGIQGAIKAFGLERKTTGGGRTRKQRRRRARRTRNRKA